MMRSTRTNVRTSTPLDNAAICALLHQHDRPVVSFRGVHEFLSNFYPSEILISYAFALPKMVPPPPQEVEVDMGDGNGTQKMWMTTTQSDQPDVAGGIAHAPTVEHAYQAMKAQDIHQFRRVLRRETAKQARADGKTMAIRPDWDQERVAVMRELVRLKFANHPKLAARLVATGPHELVEGNTWGDRFWGATALTTADDPAGMGMRLWRAGDGYTALAGENWLGKILMERRAVLAKGGG